MTELITVTEAVKFLHLDDTTSPVDEQDMIVDIIIAARQHAENFLNRTIVERERTLVLDAFATVIELLNGDVSSVDEIAYVDSNGDDATVDDHILSKNRLTAAHGADWPVARDQLGAVTITYTAGYTPTGDSPAVNPTPKPIIRAMYLMIGDMFDNREAVSQSFATYKINPTTENLLFPYRIDLGV